MSALPQLSSGRGGDDVHRFEAILAGDEPENMEKKKRPHPDDMRMILISYGLYKLSGTLIRRFYNLGHLEDITNATRCLRLAIHIAPEYDILRLLLLNQLGWAYSSRYQLLGNLDDTNKAIESIRQSVAFLGDDIGCRVELLGNLGSTYMDRFERIGDVEDLENAIEYQTQAMRLAPDGFENQPGVLSNLGRSYLSRFRCYGDFADLDNAIRCQVEAVELSPDDHIDRPNRLSRLGLSYLNRFNHLGDIEDGNKAIKWNRQAVQLAPDGNIGKPGWLSNLGISYRFRFKRHGHVADAKNAIECFTRALQLAPNDHANTPGLLGNLGASHLDRFEHHGDVADVDNSIEFLTKALQLAPDDDPGRSIVLIHLGKSYMHRFDLRKDIADVDKSLEYYVQAIKLTPDGHQIKLRLLNNVGDSYLRRFNHRTLLSDLEAASESFKQAAQAVSGDPNTRFIASRKWAQCSILLDVSPQLAYQRTMELVPQLVWLGVTISRRYDLLQTIGDAAMDAASWAIKLQVYDYALEWLEQGRAVVWNQILQLRTPFDDLYAVQPELARRLKKVASELERAGSRPTASLPTDNDSNLERDAQQHRRLAKDWDRLLEQAREHPGFENFMRPRKAAELMRAARDGPIIVLNVHWTRCDALIIEPKSDRIAHVPLDNFSKEKVTDFHAQLRDLVGHRGARDRGFQRVIPLAQGEKLLATMLRALWSDIVKPIFDFLGHTRELSIEEMPHVTWCTTGPLSFLPLHAAGCYDGLQPNALKLAVSSYIPTLSALLTSSYSAPLQPSGVLAVGQQHTKGHSDLPCTIQELASIKEHASAVGYFQLDGNNATVNAVLNAMEEYNWVHLACHAAQHKENPTQSAFLLHDGNLMLSTITQKSFKNKGLAFLSACQTATGDEKLPDEAVHLAAGMLMAGYPSVIATMWSIQDEDAPGVAGQVYANLLKDGRMDHTQAARALHQAVVALRDRVGECSFERWVPYVHIGF